MTVCTGKGSSTRRKGGLFWTHAQSKHPSREQPSFAGGPRHGRKPPSWLHRCQGRRRDAFTSNNPASVSTRLAGAPGNAELQHRRPENRPCAKKRPKPLEPSTPTRGAQGAHHCGVWAHTPRLRPSRGFCQGWGGVFLCSVALSPLGGGDFSALRVLGSGSVFSSLPITRGELPAS